MKFALALAFCALSCVPAFAKDITLNLNDQEQASLIGMLDAITRAEGLQALPAINHWENKIETAQKEALKAPAPASADPKLMVHAPAPHGAHQEEKKAH